MDREELFENFVFGGCHIRSATAYAFSAQIWEEFDALDEKPTVGFFYFADREEEQRWAARGIAMGSDVVASAVFDPEELWLFVMRDGEVYAVGTGISDFEEPIDPNRHTLIASVRCIAGGKVVAAGPRRTVYVRHAAGQWQRLDNGLFPNGEDAEMPGAGFRDVGGFSLNELYACGGDADLWKYDGQIWQQIDLPTNLPLEKLHCASDGFVYIIAGKNFVLKGRDTAWQIIETGAPPVFFEELTDFDGRILVSTEDVIYEIVDNEFVPSGLIAPSVSTHAHMDARDGILLVAGTQDAAVFDGQDWTVVLEANGQ